MRGAKSAKRGDAAPPSSGSVISAPPRKNSSDALSGLQNTFPGTPSLVTWVGGADPSARTT